MKYLFALLSLSLFMGVASQTVRAQDMPAHPVAPIAQKEMLDKPHMKTDDVLAWAVGAAAEVMTFSYDDYETRFKKSALHFTKSGWESFATGLAQSQLLEMSVQHKRRLSAMPEALPKLVQEAPRKGVYAWHILLPLRVTVFNSNASQGAAVSEVMTLSLVVERSEDNAEGLGIAEWAQVVTPDAAE